MLDLFDMLSPRVVVIPDCEYKKQKLKKLESRRDAYQEAVDELNKAIKDLV